MYINKKKRIKYWLSSLYSLKCVINIACCYKYSNVFPHYNSISRVLVFDSTYLLYINHHYCRVTGSAGITTGSAGVIGVGKANRIPELVVQAINNHRNSQPTTLQALKAIRAMTTSHSENKVLFAEVNGILMSVLRILRAHMSHDTTVENAAWILGKDKSLVK